MKSKVKLNVGDMVKYDSIYKQAFGIVVGRPPRQVTIHWLSNANTQTYSLNSMIMDDIVVVSK